jgi:hypothetical protein
MFKCLVSCQSDFANIVTSKLPQLTVLAYVTQLIMCHEIEELSSDDSYANGLVILNLDYTLSPFAIDHV